MAATATMQQLQNGLKGVEDDLGSFIKAQKNNLRKEKLQLGRNAQEGGLENEKFPASSSSHEIRKKVEVTTTEETGLNLGGYEIKQEKLREERHREYKQYLEDQSKRRLRGGEVTRARTRARGMTGDELENTRNGNREYDSRKHAASPVQNRNVYRTDIDKEYGNMLQKKKNEESLYRSKYDVANDSTEYKPAERINERRKSGKKIIEFDDSDDELFKYVLQEKEKSRRLQRGGSASAEKAKKENCEYDDDGRSSSVPPPKVPYIFGGSSHANVRNMRNREHKEALEEQIKEKQLSNINNSHIGLSVPAKMPYVFGGSSHTMMKRQINIEHKHALEEQIKEKEEIKTREKLMRIGKIGQTSAKANQYPSNLDIDINNEVLNNDITKLVKTDQYGQHSNLNGSVNNKMGNTRSSLHQGNINNVNNMNGGYPIQNSYGVNPMFNPMMMYPVGWPGYGSMMPNSYAPNNMEAFPQGHTTRQQADTNEHVLNNDNLESYVPSAIDKINHPKPSIKIYTNPYITSGGSLNESDSSAKRAQQIAYQNELKNQMEIKKAATKKERLDREKYEIKLEKEIAEYDPWGKSGCGAPVKNRDGRIVADLRKLLQDKENGAVSTSIDNNIVDKLPDDLSPLLKALEMTQKAQEATEKDDIQHDDTSPSHKRGAFAKELQGLTSPRDKEEQNSYKAFLRQQVEEKKRKEDEIKEKARLEEEKENTRLSLQQQQMREEYETEKEKQRKKAEEIRQENEARGLIIEQKRIEEERKKRELEDERDADRKMEAEMKLAQDKGSLNEIVLPQRSNSPPVPGVAKKERKKTVKQVIQTENIETMQYLNTIRDNLNNIKEKETVRSDKQIEMHEQVDLIKQLSALRKQLIRQEEKVQSDLQRNKKEYSNLVSATEWNQNQKVNKRSAFDRATSVTSGRKRDAGKFSAIDQFMYDDNYKKEQVDLDTQQQEYMRQQEMRLLALRQGVENSTLPSEFRLNRQASKQSLLESESKFFAIDNHKIMGNTRVQSRNGYKHKDSQLETDVNLMKVLNKPDATDSPATETTSTLNLPDATDTPSISASMSTLQVENIAHRNEERLANLNDADIAQKNKERLNKLEQDEGGGENFQGNEENDKIINDLMQDE